MKVLLAFPENVVVKQFSEYVKRDAEAKKCTYKHIDIEFKPTGYTDFETSYHITDAFKKRDMHLVLYAGLANSLNNMMKTGEVVNVINELPYQYGQTENNEFSSAYQLNWLNRNEYPHQRGGFINLTNSYFNIFLPIMKTAAISCRTLGGTQEELDYKLKNYPIHIETGNGLAFQYACLYKRIGFYQLRAIEKNYLTKVENKDLAIKNLNKELIRIIDLL